MRLTTFLKAAIAIADHILRRGYAFPFRALSKRDSGRWVVIGRDDGRFVDNAKHFYCWLHAHAPPNFHITFVTEDAATVECILKFGARAVLYPGKFARNELLHAGIVILDNNHPFHRGHINWFRGARTVQLWHGSPLKQIELFFHYRRIATLSPFKRSIANLQARLIDAFPSPSIMISSSAFFTKHVFDKCFQAKLTIETGYPRNDCLFEHDVSASGLLNINVDKEVSQRLVNTRARGGRTVLYAPTYRDDLRSQFEGDGIDLAKWADAARSDNYTLILKLHPEMVGRAPIIADDHVVQVEPRSDIYPILRHIDVLVTDYSSILFDFLLLDRPVVLFPYDLDRYISHDRPLIFNYDKMTPGPKALNFDMLLKLVRKTLEDGQDRFWKEERDRVRHLAFDHLDGRASQRVWFALTREEGRTP